MSDDFVNFESDAVRDEASQPAKPNGRKIKSHNGANGDARPTDGESTGVDDCASREREPIDQPDALEAIFGKGLPLGVALGTDLATACLVHEHHGADLMHSSELGWVAWDGRRFASSGTVAPSRFVQIIGRRLELGALGYRSDAANAEDEHERKQIKAVAAKLERWAAVAQSAGGVRHALELAQTLVHTPPEELDTDPMLLNVLNGTIDLRTGTLREHRRADKITRLAPVVYDPQATAPRWERFLTEILPNADVRAFVERYHGYALTGLVSEQALVIALGDGNNGKSVLAELVRRLLGDYARDTPTDSLMHSRHGMRGTENDIARLRGSRFVTAKETEQDRRLDEPRIKALTGGDTVTARFLYREHFEFIPTFKLWLYANHRPVIRGVDLGIWRRINLVPFTQTIAADKRDPKLGEKLWAEAPGILAHLVRACLEWQRDGLQPPEAVRAATSKWRDESDDVAEFVGDTEHCLQDDMLKAYVDELHERYVAWSRKQGDNNRPALNKQMFGKRLQALGFEPGKSGSKRCWKGIGLQPLPEPDELEGGEDEDGGTDGT